MKSVLLSIQPKWCELIASGKKTVEVRKTKPKIDAPFKCYIYCTKESHKNTLHTYVNSGYGRKKFGVIGHWRSGKEIVDVNPHLPAYRYNAYLAEGKVIGEFVCDYIRPEWEVADGLVDVILEKSSCLTYKELIKYANGKPLYSWNISNLVIYENPKELSQFLHYCEYDFDLDKCIGCKKIDYNDLGQECCDRRITRPPQSWCYVEEVGEDNG